ncbi:MAG: rhodanese-like domain-containing protein [Cyanobacteria bacterium SBLK]|nr:rhodanese-like domain-containing protein [Cyanobacteria bacterium SBLK]
MQLLTSGWVKSRKVLVAIALGIILLGLAGAIAAQNAPYSSGDRSALNAGEIPLITAEQLQQAQKSQNFIFIDVRTPREYESDRIQNSILIPIDAIERGSGAEKVREIATQNPDSTIVLYCQRGPRSYRAYRHLQAIDSQFVVLSGGITAWRKTVSAE